MITIRGLTVAQWPNRSLATAMLATAVAVATSGRVSRGANGVAGAAMIVWGYQEMFDGVNWFRRGLGVGGVAVAVVGLRSQLAERPGQAPAA